jgi:hypothetical protein
MGDDGPEMIQGGGGQGLGSESSEEPPELKTVRSLLWRYGEGPVGHEFSPKDLLPYRWTDGGDLNKQGSSTSVAHEAGSGQ